MNNEEIITRLKDESGELMLKPSVNAGGFLNRSHGYFYHPQMATQLL